MGSWFLWAVSVQYAIAGLCYAYQKNLPMTGLLWAYAFANICLIYGAK